MNAVIILSGGNGARMQSLKLPKQLLCIGGKPALERCLNSFLAHDEIACIVLVVNRQYLAEHLEVVSKMNALDRIIVVEGGKDRHESSAIGLSALLGKGVNSVIFHDVARPFVPHDVISSCLDAMKDYDGAVAGVSAIDTIGVKGQDGCIREILDRQSLISIQTPQCFRFDSIAEAYTQLKNKACYTDNAGVMLGYNSAAKIKLVEGSRDLHKLTNWEDLAILEKISANFKLKK